MASLAMALGGTFVASDYEQEESFSLLPPGEYRATITDSELKNTAKGGQLLKLTLQIQSGEFANRKVWDQLNLVCPTSDQAETIARRRLSTLCNIMGIGQLKDTSQLHGKPMLINVGIRKDTTGQYSDQNTIKSYAAIAGKPQAVKPAAKPVPAPVDEVEMEDVPF